MDVKGAIEKVKNLNGILYEETISDIISVLKRGEKLKVENVELKKYKAIWEEFVDYDSKGGEIIIDLEALERKHFPEGIKRKMKFRFPKLEDKEGD